MDAVATHLLDTNQEAIATSVASFKSLMKVVFLDIGLAMETYQHRREAALEQKTADVESLYRASDLFPRLSSADSLLSGGRLAVSMPSEPRKLPEGALKPAARGPGFAVQVGAFGDESAARRFEGRLRALGLEAYVSEGDDSATARYRVRVGPVASREEADQLAVRIHQEHQLPTWILSEGRP